MLKKSYIFTVMFFEHNNSCAVLNYVKIHFQCNTRDLVDPGYTRNFPVLTLPIPGDDGNNDLPDEDGPYNENDRKPIWWYHSDHLGSSTYLTDNFGRPSHYYETLPFGEMIVEHNQSSFYDNKYKFNDFGEQSDQLYSNEPHEVQSWMMLHKCIITEHVIMTGYTNLASS